jgi:hypothetical protein
MSRSASHASVLAEMSVIDFLAVLFGYAISGELSQRLQLLAVPFMALFERERDDGPGHAGRELRPLCASLGVGRVRPIHEANEP